MVWDCPRRLTFVPGHCESLMMLSSVPAVWLWREILRAEALTKGRKAFIEDEEVEQRHTVKVF